MALFSELQWWRPAQLPVPSGESPDDRNYTFPLQLQTDRAEVLLVEEFPLDIHHLGKPKITQNSDDLHCFQ